MIGKVKKIQIDIKTYDVAKNRKLDVLFDVLSQMTVPYGPETMTCLFFPSSTRMVTIEFFKHLKTVYSNFLFGKHTYAGVDIVVRVLQFFLDSILMPI